MNNNKKGIYIALLVFYLDHSDDATNKFNTLFPSGQTVKCIIILYWKLSILWQD